jgi:hypothetical protein
VKGFIEPGYTRKGLKESNSETSEGVIAFRIGYRKEYLIGENPAKKYRHCDWEMFLTVSSGNTDYMSSWEAYDLEDAIVMLTSKI